MSLRKRYLFVGLNQVLSVVFTICHYLKNSYVIKIVLHFSGVISGKEMETIMNAAPLTDDERNCYIEIARNKGLTVVKEGYVSMSMEIFQSC